MARTKEERIKTVYGASNPVPSDMNNLKELWDWHVLLVDAKNEWKEQIKKVMSRNKKKLTYKFHL